MMEQVPSRVLALMLLLMVTLTHAEEKSFFGDRERGWFWYKQPPAPAKEPEKTEAKPVPIVVSPGKAEIGVHDALKKRSEELLQIAYVNPTEANVLAYLKLQNQLVRQASTFSDVWQRVVWAHPELAFANEGRPTSAQEVQVYERVQAQERSATLAGVAKTHALMYYFRSDCPYCQQFAPVLRRYADTHGLTVFAVSLDGRSSPEFPAARADNGSAATLGVSSVPALYLVEPGSGKIAPVGVGILAETELTSRIHTIINAPVADAAVRPLNVPGR